MLKEKTNTNYSICGWNVEEFDQDESLFKWLEWRKVQLTGLTLCTQLEQYQHESIFWEIGWNERLKSV